MSFKAEIKASLGWSWDDGAVDNDRLDYAEQLLDGNGDNQAEAVWHLDTGGAGSDEDDILIGPSPEAAVLARHQLDALPDGLSLNAINDIARRP